MKEEGAKERRTEEEKEKEKEKIKNGSKEDGREIGNLEWRGRSSKVGERGQEIDSSKVP